MDVKEALILGEEADRHWYYATKGRAAINLVEHLHVDELIDVGAGAGVFSRKMLDAGIADRAVCVDLAYAVDRESIHNGRPIRYVRSVDVVPQRLILLMDVLEHVDDDVALVRQYTDRMPIGGYVLVTVPAFRFLWSSHDIYLEHRRRYTRKQLRKTLESAALDIIRVRYFFASLFPFVAFMRLLDRWMLSVTQRQPSSALRKYHRVPNAILTLIHDLERHWLFPYNIVCGLSVIGLARKNR